MSTDASVTQDAEIDNQRQTQTNCIRAELFRLGSYPTKSGAQAAEAERDVVLSSLLGQLPDLSSGDLVCLYVLALRFSGTKTSVANG